MSAFITAFDAEARQSSKKGGGEFRFRSGFLYGRVDYNSLSHSTNAVTTFDGSQYGARADLEVWFSSKLGVLLDGSYMQAELLDNSNRFRGDPIYHAWGAFNFGYRLFGNGGATGSEFVTFAGPALEWFSDVRAYRGETFYDLNRPQVLGLKLGARWRWAFAKNYVSEIGGFWILPFTLRGTGSNNTLNKGATRSYGSTVSVEKRIAHGINLGAGFNYEQHRLEYKIGGAPGPQVVDFNLTTALFFIRFWF